MGMCLLTRLVSLVSLFKDITTIVGFLMPKLFSYSWEDKGVHTFPKGICPKVNVIAWLEYELAYYDSAVHRFNPYATRTPPFSDQSHYQMAVGANKSKDSQCILNTSSYQCSVTDLN